MVKRPSPEDLPIPSLAPSLDSSTLLSPSFSDEPPFFYNALDLLRFGRFPLLIFPAHGRNTRHPLSLLYFLYFSSTLHTSDRSLYFECIKTSGIHVHFTPSFTLAHCDGTHQCVIMDISITGSDFGFDYFGSGKEPGSEVKAEMNRMETNWAVGIGLLFGNAS